MKITSKAVTTGARTEEYTIELPDGRIVYYTDHLDAKGRSYDSYASFDNGEYLEEQGEDGQILEDIRTMLDEQDRKENEKRDKVLKKKEAAAKKKK